MILDVVQILGISWMDPNWLLHEFGGALFWISLAMIFVECGLFFPFLPGDTLLFALGLFISTDKISILPGPHGVDLAFSLALFFVAAVTGNVAGYEIGRKIGPPLAERNGRILKKKYFDQTREFFDTHGNKALVIGRFVPFVRTYVTVVAGISQMDRRRFFTWSAVGAGLWVVSITLLGYFLGNVPKVGPFLSANIDYAILVILLLTVIPLGVEWFRHRRHGPPEAASSAPSAPSAPADHVSDVEV